MKQSRTMWALLLVMAIIAAACGSGDATSESTTTTAAGSESTETTQPETTTTEAAPVDTPAEAVSIRYFTFSAAPDHLGDLDAMIAAFNEVHPEITVEVETAPFDEYFSVLQTQIAGGDAPDAFELNFESFVSFASKGVLAELDVDTSGYYDRAAEAFALDGTQYALPESYSTVLLFFNKDLFDQAGVDYPTRDWTWADEQAAAEAISALGDTTWGSFAGIQFWEFYKTADQNGCSFFTDGAVSINQPACVEALQYMLDNVNNGLQPTAAEMGGVSDGEMFVNGELGMITTGIWMFGSFEEATFDWDVAVEPGNTQGGSHFFANGVAVSADSENQEAAAEWVSFLTGSPESAKIRVDAAWELPTLTDASLYDAYLSQPSPANRQAVLDSLENVTIPPVIERQAEMQDAVNGLLEKAVAGEITAQEALDQAQAAIEELVK